MKNTEETRYLSQREYELWQSENAFHQSWVESLKEKYATISWCPNPDLNIEVVLFNRHFIDPPEHLRSLAISHHLK